MRFLSSHSGNALCASLFAGLYVISHLGEKEWLVLAWFVVLVVTLGATVRRRRLGIACVALLVHVTVASAVVTLAVAAPVKTRDRFLAGRVSLPKAELTLRELKDLGGEVGRRRFGTQVWLSYPDSQADTVIRWPAREMTLREFVAKIEGQTPLRHSFGGCGNGSTVLFGGNCCFGLTLSPPHESK